VCPRTSWGRHLLWRFIGGVPKISLVRLPRLSDRSAGILLHPTSLPGTGAKGELGRWTRRFADFLADAGQRWWQMLPLGPPGYGDSPYSALSAFAGSPALISVERLIEEGLVDARPPASREATLRMAFENFRRRSGRERDELAAYCEGNRDWLDDFALFWAIKRAQGLVQWTRWPAPLRDRQPGALEEARARLADDIDLCRFEQYRFDADWRALRQHCQLRGVALIGDLPIFVAHDSADVWQHRELFHLDEHGEPTVIAGVPPDYFSATGQRWGNPLYRWPVMANTGFHWWIERFRAALDRFDAIRLDHFIGFSRYWEIPADEPTAVNGRWVPGPGLPFFRAVRKALGEFPLIAENLGAVTPAVEQLRRQLNAPGIRILQFAFGTDPQAPLFLPHAYRRNTAVYTGTHDNDTVVGWFNDPGGSESRSVAQVERERQAALRYLGAQDGREIHWEMIRALYASVANLVLVPMQDVLGLGNEARMNRPGVALGNWTWRLDERAPLPALARRLHDLAATYQRLDQV
jgi:4-alpha-glucanotransferase